MDEENECPECEGGLPGWLATFADLMSLLLVFFVLLLSFSEIDVQKYKQLAGSLKAAFGVQRDVEATEIPKGTSIIAQEFSPGTPQPTIVNQVRQQTTDTPKQHLLIPDPAVADARKKAKELEEKLKELIKDGLLEVKTIDDQVVIRILDKGSFPSASARVGPGFRETLIEIAEALNKLEGPIIVAGHTDDIPIQTLEFPSNWLLAGARAAGVAHTRTRDGIISPERIEIRAHADNRPIDTNETAEGRAKNRRVEIIVLGERSSQFLIEMDAPNAQPGAAINNNSTIVVQ